MYVPIDMMTERLNATARRACHRRLLSLVAAAIAATCFFIDSPIEGSSRVLAKHNLLYDETCPFVEKAYATEGMDHNAAREYSRASGAPQITHLGLQEMTKDSHKIVLSGDSNFRQIFMSTACFAFGQKFLHEEGDSYTIAWTKKSSSHLYSYSDARAMLKNSSELFYSPSAGKIQTFGWPEELNAMRTNEHGQDWIQSCKAREKFQLDTYALEAPNKKVMVWDKSDNNLDTVELNANDKVVFNAGMHPAHRSGNLDVLKELMDCVNQAREKGEDPGWPTIYYFRSNQLHFKTKSGLYSGSRGGGSFDGCADYVRGDLQPQFKQELDALKEKMPMLGYRLNLDHVGRLHLGDKKKDCSHWTMPGVPDVYAKEIFAGVYNLKTHVSESE